MAVGVAENVGERVRVRVDAADSVAEDTAEGLVEGLPERLDAVACEKCKSCTKKLSTRVIFFAVNVYFFFAVSRVNYKKN